MSGAGAVTETPWGLVGVRAAGSVGATGAGVAVGFDWSAVNFEGLTGARGESMRPAAEYRSPNFHTPGEISTFNTGIIYPEWNLLAEPQCVLLRSNRMPNDSVTFGSLRIRK